MPSSLVMRYLDGSNSSEYNGEIEESRVYTAVLFPWFVQTLGIVTSYFLSRYLPHLPYTGVMFVEGVILGVLFEKTGLKTNPQLGASIGLWVEIDPETLILVFLPALLFGDALHVNYHLFKRAFFQILWLAFPGMLLGTVLTAVFAFYSFPYGWSFNLSMTFGSILAATDPVAVVSLLDEVGAPPRLKMLISGESMLNDGAAIVFFQIFSALFFYEETGGVLGRTFNGAEGAAIFFRESLGGAAIGIAFGCGTIILLRYFNRKFEREDTIIQVTITITMAYLAFYTAQAIAETSGVLAVVFCGILINTYALPKIHDRTTLANVWDTIEYLGNTLLFTLGGVVWGSILSDENLLSDENGNIFNPRDWGFLIALYLAVTIIRAVMILVSFPILKYVGLSTNTAEASFMVWGGLRGAVGIALALSLDNSVEEFAPENKELRRLTVQVFFFVGGIAFLTLLFNGPTSGKVLKWLGLVRISQVQRETIEAIKHHIKMEMVNKYVELTSDERFEKAEVNIVISNVSYLKTAREDISKAKKLKKMHDKYEPQHEVKMNVEIDEDDNETDVDANSGVKFHEPMNLEQTEEEIKKIQSFKRLKLPKWKATLGSLVKKKVLGVEEETKLLQQQREIFLELLRAAYWDQIKRGELYYKFSVYALLQSLDLSKEQVKKGGGLNDWSSVRTVSNSFESQVEIFFTAILNCFVPAKGLFRVQEQRLAIFTATCFIHAHIQAEEEYKLSFIGEDIGVCVQKILDESEEQKRLAQAVINSASEKTLKIVISYLVSALLLHYQGTLVGKLKEEGLLEEKIAGEMLHELSLEVSNLKYKGSRRIIKYDPITRIGRSIKRLSKARPRAARPEPEPVNVGEDEEQDEENETVIKEVDSLEKGNPLSKS